MKSLLPLRSTIIEILRDKDGVMLDSDLIIALKARYGKNAQFSDAEINKALLSLETLGLIHVVSITKNKRRIMKISEEMGYLSAEED